MFQGKARKSWDLESTYAVRIVKVPFITRYVPTTHNMAKKLAKVGGRKGVFACYMYLKYNVTEGKPNYDLSLKFFFSC